MAGRVGARGRAGAFTTAQCLVSAALALVAGMLVGELFQARPADAQSAPAAGGDASGVVVVAGQVARDIYGLYLVDLRHGTICVYQYSGAERERRLRLVAARAYLYDCQLDSYNTEPAPEEVRNLVRGARRLKEVTTTRSAP